MRSARAVTGFVAAVVAMASLWPESGRADESPGDAKSLLTRAIAYHGGKEALRELPHLKSKGAIEAAGRMAGRSFDMVIYERSDGGLRSEATFEMRGRKITAVEIYDGKMCKRRFRSTWDDLPLDENRERAAHRLTFLVDALDRSPVVAGSGEELGVAVWKIEVPDGRGKAILSLAKDDGHLVSLEFPGTEADGMGTKKEVTRKHLYHSFKKIGGVTMPIDIETLKDGSPDGRFRIETIEVIKEWDAAWLEIPDPRKRFIPSEELAN